jgi:hypothetical protein
MNKLSLASVLALTAAAAAARADGSPTPPSSQVVNVQGVLRNSAGALQSAAFGLDVSLFATASGGSAFFTQHLPTVPVENGYFSIELGGDALNFSGAPDAWIEVQVAGDSGPLPRMHVSAVPYALQCSNANTLGGQPGSYYVDTATEQTIAGVKHFGGKVSFADTVTVGSGDATTVLDVHGDIGLNGGSLSTTINVRHLVPYNSAAAYCPSGSVPIYTPRRYLGKSGAEICAADIKHKATCAAVKQLWVAADNTSGGYAPGDLDCSKPVWYPWPWGQDFDAPDTLGNEWGHGNTLVVCCQ